MDQTYDVIVLGTGFKECLLSGLASVAKQSVLHLDRNSYYGADTASLSLEQLYARFRPGTTPPKELGRSRDWSIDIIPKFIMACGDLVKMLLHTRVTRYLDFKSITGSYVLQGNKPHKVPATPAEALSSSLLGIFQKRRFKNFLQFVSEYKEEVPSTHNKLNLNAMTGGQLFKEFSLDEGTQLFTGHAIALYPDDSYLRVPANEIIARIKLFAYSLSRYGNSPFIYPLYGIGGLPEGFSRLGAIYGATFMLNRPVDEIIYKDGKVAGIKSNGEVAHCKKLVADPSYFIGTDKVKLVGKIARAICILSHPIPNTNTEAAQIILPGKELNRRNDIYISMVSSAHYVCPNGKWVAVASTNVESKDEKTARAELQPAFNLMGKVDEEFFWVSDCYEPTGDGSSDNIFITSSYDASSHFESATKEALAMYTRLTGQKLDLNISADPEDLENKEMEMPAPTPAQNDNADREESKVIKNDLEALNKALEDAGPGPDTARGAHPPL